MLTFTVSSFNLAARIMSWTGLRIDEAPGRRCHDQDPPCCQEPRVLVYPSSIDLSSRTLRYLTGQLASRRREIGTRWRRMTSGRQALLALAHLRCGDTYAQLAAGFKIGQLGTCTSAPPSSWATSPEAALIRDHAAGTHDRGKGNPTLAQQTRPYDHRRSSARPHRRRCRCRWRHRNS